MADYSMQASWLYFAPFRSNHRMFHRASLACRVFALVAAVSVASANAVDLKGKFVLGGDDPTPQPVPIPKSDTGRFLPGLQLYSEDLIVDPKSRGIANIFVSVRTADVPITPEATAAVKPELTIEVKDGRFQPHAGGIWVGRQRLMLKNSDADGGRPELIVHGKSPSLHPFETGTSFEDFTGKSSAVPHPILCGTHRWKRGLILKRDNPYFAVTAADGSFEIKHLPKSVPLEFQVWHEKSGWVVARPEWEKGRFTITLDADEDLGTIAVPPTEF